MPTYTVNMVSDKVRPWSSSKGGPMKSYRMQVKDDAGQIIDNVEWSRKESSPAPTVGQVLEGTIDMEGEFGPKFKAAQGGGFGGGRPRTTPEERRSIQMQHAQKCAVEALKLAAEYGEGDNKYRPPSAGDVVEQVKLIANGLFQQIEGVAQ